MKEKHRVLRKHIVGNPGLAWITRKGFSEKATFKVSFQEGGIVYRKGWGGESWAEKMQTEERSMSQGQGMARGDTVSQRDSVFLRRGESQTGRHRGHSTLPSCGPGTQCWPVPCFVSSQGDFSTENSLTPTSFRLPSLNSLPWG